MNATISNDPSRPAADRQLPPADQRPASEPLAALRAPPKKILLVDDDASVREMLGRVLKSEHYEVILARDGNEAAAKFLSRRPHLVLLDLNMPERDGWSAFRFMEAAQPLLPVILITARADQYSQAENLGVDALMEKPLDLSVLLEAIEKMLAEPKAARFERLNHPQFKTARLSSPKAL